MRSAVSFTEGHTLWKNADAVLAIGTRLYWQQSVWGVDENLPIVRLDIDPDEIDRFRRPACALVGDAATVLHALLSELPAHNRARRRRNAELAAVRAAFAERLARQEPPMGFLRAIRAALPDDGIYVEEVTQIGFASRLAFPVHAPRTFLSPGYQDTLGWGYGTALGAQAAAPGRKVVLATGDGGFMFQAAELATAMRHRLPGSDRGVRRWRVRKCTPHPGAAVRQPADRQRSDKSGFRAVRRELRDGRIPRDHAASAGNDAASGVRAECAGPGARAGRSDAEPVGHDPVAARPGLRRCMAAGVAVVHVGVHRHPRNARTA